MKSNRAVKLLGSAALGLLVSSCGEGQGLEEGPLDAPSRAVMALNSTGFPVSGFANLYQRTDPGTVVSGSIDPIRVPDARLCGGQQIQIAATGCVVDDGPNCTGPNG